MANLGEEGAFTVASDMSMTSSFGLLTDAGTWPCSDLPRELQVLSRLRARLGRAAQEPGENIVNRVCKVPCQGFGMIYTAGHRNFQLRQPEQCIKAECETYRPFWIYSENKSYR